MKEAVGKIDGMGFFTSLNHIRNGESGLTGCSLLQN